jgi:hypothetical protein
VANWSEEVNKGFQAVVVTFPEGYA